MLVAVVIPRSRKSNRISVAHLVADTLTFRRNKSPCQLEGISREGGEWICKHMTLTSLTECHSPPTTSNTYTYLLYFTVQNLEPREWASELFTEDLVTYLVGEEAIMIAGL